MSLINHLPMFLQHFNPAQISGELLVNRQEELRWLKEGFSSYFEQYAAGELAENAGLSFCIMGEKGVGKSILAERLMLELRTPLSTETLFVKVDCRSKQQLREVLRDIALQSQEQLNLIGRIGTKVSDALMDTVGILVEVTRHDEVEFRTVQESIRRYKQALQLAGKRNMLGFLNLSFKLSLERNDQDSQSLAGKITFDDGRLVKLLFDFFRDLREAGFLLFLLLDNVDELRHSYREPEERKSTQRDAEWVLQLHEAPIALLVCMRTYFGGVLPRGLQYTRTLLNLPPQELLRIYENRCHRESQKTQQKLGVQAMQIAQELAQLQPTPLAFLRWFEFVAQYDFKRTVREASADFLASRYASMDGQTLRRLIRKFAAVRSDRATLTSQEVLEVLSGNQAQLAQAQDLQAILPKDFWNPIEFTLDPELLWIAE